jgi:hypothetical protein
MRRLLTFIVVFIFTTASFADESQIVVIKKDTKAPFTGILIDTKTGAKILAEREFEIEKCQVRVDYEKDRTKSKCELAAERAQASLLAEKDKRGIIIETQKKENERLLKIIEEEGKDYSTLWFSGGALTGIILSIGIFYASVQITR